MAKNSIRDYSATNSNNTDIQSIDISEGCSPAGINNAIREVMADLKDVSTGAVALESPAADSLTVTGDLTVDTNTLYVDSTNNNVGIGTNSPAQLLHVNTTSAGSARIRVQNSEGYAEIATDGTDGFLTAGGTEILRFESGGNVGIGTSSPADKLEIHKAVTGAYSGGVIDGGLRIDTGYSAAIGSYGHNGITFYGDADNASFIYQIHNNNSTSQLAIGTNNTERMRIDSNGIVGIGVTPFANNIGKGLDTANGAGMFGSSNSNYLTANLYYNSGWKYKASASGSLALLDGTGDIKFYNAPAGSAGAAATVTERMRINSGGTVLIAKTSSALSTTGHEFSSTGYVFNTRDGGNVLYLNRLTNDGTLIAFYQDNTLEGNIAVSGTTVSLNGGHLARWSQLTDGTRDETIVKGTVLTNLDQMAVWHHEAVAATYYVEGDELPEITPATYYTEDDTLPEGVSVGDEKTAAVYAQIGDEKTPAADAYTEDNEQLNCMAVSSVEGDPNVAGVFVNWDNDDDEFNDMNIAMTGDMVIRIAQGTTVARGDLLMSAGDGTAKPQGDDIVRSKTIAKVTSTHVSHTYDDGSYLVPCVLMAC